MGTMITYAIEPHYMPALWTGLFHNKIHYNELLWVVGLVKQNIQRAEAL